jgi:hypothetical protein
LDGADSFSILQLEVVGMFSLLKEERIDQKRVRGMIQAKAKRGLEGFVVTRYLATYVASLVMLHH